MPHPLAGHYNYKTTNWDDIFSRAEDGNLEAIAIGANILFQGFGHPLINPNIKIDTLLARQWLEQGAAIESTNNDNERLCTVMHALMQAANIGMVSKEQEALGRETLLKNRAWMQAEAEAGNAAVLRILSFMHGRGGFGVERSADKAIELLSRAAEKNDPFALYDLGTLKTGAIRESDKDEVEAARYFKRAALMGHADAQRDLGVLIINKLRTDAVTARIMELTVANPSIAHEYDGLQNLKFGLDILETSAAQGRLGAMYSLGVVYSGIPSLRNLPTAVSWFKKAVDEGFPRAYIQLAKLYEVWFKEMGENHPEHNKATALTIYNHLLGRPRKQGGVVVVATQALKDEQIAEAQKRRLALETEALSGDKTWYRYANGDRRLIFDDGTSVILGPYQDATDGSKDVAKDIARAKDYEAGRNGHVKSLNEAYSIYRDILARKEGGEYTLPTQDQIKEIRRLVRDIEKRANETITQPDGKRTLIYKKQAFNGSDELVFAGPKAEPDYKAKKAEKKADASTGTPARPADTSQTTDKDKKRDKGNKPQR